MNDPESISLKLSDAGFGKYFKLKNVIDLKEMYQPHFRMWMMRKEIIDAN